ncbi:C-terminal binding protein [Actinomadura opuntiae]|uniref:C-terminal binding protein n=1 Tax=Actinomadura sp. OS1-43 TaxID=604315 RepID=UPI00255AD201|nr:C-terminal binding protein [Actinomadura sp. OS1-43]MDL4814239.1 C-terminal binding protein [Actinomadura sp. OS1-43]
MEREILDAELLVAETGEEDELIALAPRADAILTCWKPVTAAVLDAAPRCRTVARYGVGLDNIDVGRATELGMVVTNVPDFCADEVADSTLLLLLALARRLGPLAADVRAGGWDNRAGGVPVRLRGKVMGLVGLGNIARHVVPRVQALGMEVLAYRRSGRASDVPPGVRVTANLGELLAQADAVSLHCPLTPQTRGLIGKDELATMKDTAFLINTSRGGIVDTDALVSALDGGVIAGAGLDVTDPEPLPAGHPLRDHPLAVITPHASFYSDGSTAELASKAARNVAAILRGERPASVVNPEVYRADMRRRA